MINLSGFNADLFNGTFDEEGVFTPSGGSSRSIPVIFDNEYSVVQGVGDTGMGIPAPQSLCKASDAPNVAVGDRLAVAGTNYYVQEVQPDGTGLVLLILSKDPL